MSITAKLDPKRENDRRDMDDPRKPTSNTETDEPKRHTLLTDSDAPKSTQSITERFVRNRKAPPTEMADPTRKMLRIESVEPR
jgi:hypothetical protein